MHFPSLLVALTLALVNPVGDLPTALAEAVRALRSSAVEDSSQKLKDVLAEEQRATESLIRRLCAPDSRDAALAQIALNDAGEAERIGSALPAGQALEALVEGLIGPYLLYHHTSPVNRALSSRLRSMASRLDKEFASALSLAPEDSRSSRKKKVELVGEWEAARSRALDVIRSRELYPDKDKGAAGQALVEDEVDRTRHAFEAVEMLVAEDLARYDERGLGDTIALLEQAERWRTAYADCVDGVSGRAGVRLPKRKLTDTDARVRFVRGLISFSAGDLELARATLFAGDAYDQSLFAFLYARGFGPYNNTYDLGPRDALRISERGIVGAINRYREMLGLVPLELDGQLIDAARGHSAEMNREKYFSHESPHPGRRSYRDRVRLAGYTNGALAECIFVGTGAVNVDEVFDGWFTSSSHHRILVSADYRQIGVGRSGNYVTAALGGGWTLPRPTGAKRMREEERGYGN